MGINALDGPPTHAVAVRVSVLHLEDNMRVISSHYCKNTIFSGSVEEVKLTQDPEPQ